MELDKAYNPKTTEPTISKLWEKSGFFNPDNLPNTHKKPYSIVLPPPNVTGNLHMGHAAMLAIEDILIRYHRMRKYRTLWLPGTDHAAIATQSKVEGILYKKEGKTKYDLGRSDFLKLVEQFAKESHDTITTQIKTIGASVDWSREAYTLDKQRTIAVRTAFAKMYNDGLIYRGERIVNWDPNMQTTVSDDEIEWKEQHTPFYYLQYGPFVIGTARPETKFGDKYVVMHPRDKRYKQYKHGEQIEVEWINGTVTATIIKDEAVDMDFGTGVMTITPWHDAVDFEIAERHTLEKEQIIDSDGKLLLVAGEFAGMHIKKARPLIVEKLRQKGLLVKTDEQYANRIATNSRGGGIIEPQIKKQWFIDVNKPFTIKKSNFKTIKTGQQVTLKELMMATVKSDQIKILPARFEKIYFHWISNLRDWCISRQIWYGHQIPVWYRGTELYVGVEKPKGTGWTQDPDTLDTWFSSGLWTFSTLGWPFDYAQGKPKRGSDLALYHPTNVLETGYDILFFWVARMILMTGYLLNDVPFHTVYLHGLVRDEQGRKMSKSLGNIIDPLTLIDRYGADATRLSLIVGATPGNDIKLSEDKVRGYRNFANKLWNITRFVLMSLEDYTPPSKKPKMSKEEEKILKEFKATAAKVTKYIETYQLSHAAETMYHYLWHTFADNIIEQSKPIVKGEQGTKQEQQARQYLLLSILADSLKLLHPFAPFATEYCYQRLPLKNKKSTLMIEEWPS